MSEVEEEKEQFNPLKKAEDNPKSRKNSIAAMCAYCMGCTKDHLEPGWRVSVRECSAKQCPLFNLRPFK